MFILRVCICVHELVKSYILFHHIALVTFKERTVLLPYALSHPFLFKDSFCILFVEIPTDTCIHVLFKSFVPMCVRWIKGCMLPFREVIATESLHIATTVKPTMYCMYIRVRLRVRIMTRVRFQELGFVTQPSRNYPIPDSTLFQSVYL